MPSLVKLCGDFCKSSSASAIALHNDFAAKAAVSVTPMAQPTISPTAAITP